jgi:YVTN family beta-propeller protein
LYAANQLADAVYVIDIDSSSSTYLTRIQTITSNINDASYPLVNLSLGKVYVLNFGNNKIVSIDTSTYSTTATTIGVGSSNFRACIYRNTIYISDFSNNRVRVFDCLTDTITESISTNNGPIGLVVDHINNLIVVTTNDTNNQTASVQFIDPVENEIIKTITLSSGSSSFFTSTPIIDSVNQRLWVVAQEYQANIINLSNFSSKSTIAFQEGINRWISKYSFWPERYGYVDNNMFSFLRGELWKHNASSTYNKFHGVQYTSQATPVFNIEPHRQKNFISMSLEADKVWAASSITTPEGQESFILSGHFEKIQNEWYADVKNDINTPNAASRDEALINGNFMQSNVLEALLETQASDIAKLRFVNVNSNYIDR